jgi:hypothetical protein
MQNKETIEEAAKEIYKEEYICNGIDIAPAWREGFVTGAKWQMDRSYSEENMEEYAEFCIRCYQKELPCIIAKDWFEQFKK